jgi:hypothetical protein
MNWNRCGRKWSWPNSKYYPGICLHELSETIKKSGDSRCLGRDSNRSPAEYKSEALPVVRVCSFISVILLGLTAEMKRLPVQWSCSPVRYVRPLKPGVKDPVNPTGVISGSLCLRLVIYRDTGINRPKSQQTAVREPWELSVVCSS